MPQIDVSYTSDLSIDGVLILKTLQNALKSADSGTGVCKGRVHAIEVFLSSHLHIDVQVLRKPHRDEAFMLDLADALKSAIEPLLKQPCELTLAVRYLPPAYITGHFEG